MIGQYQFTSCRCYNFLLLHFKRKGIARRFIGGGNINAALQGIPAAIAVITEKIGPGHIESYLPGFFMLEVKVPDKGDYDGKGPADPQNYAVKKKSF